MSAEESPYYDLAHELASLSPRDWALLKDTYNSPSARAELLNAVEGIRLAQAANRTMGADAAPALNEV